ncbi:uncharacterized protein LOC117729886 isoform X2 [Cyclopterus lumpus]|nr:uncharacterized protein LOC117729886 isoform X2 [Cyclopterus lumpus]
MDYIKDRRTTARITVGIMERHQAGQEEALVEVGGEEGRLEAAHGPRGSPAGRRGCLNCAVALATAMGLVTVALAAAFILHLVTFTAASCNQDSSPPNAQAEFNVTWKQQRSDEPGRYDICTVNKSANYLIYGEAKSPASREASLVQTWKNVNGIIRTVRRKDGDDEGEFIFLDKVNLFSGTRISIRFQSAPPTSCRFLVFRL